MNAATLRAAQMDMLAAIESTRAQITSDATAPLQDKRETHSSYLARVDAFADAMGWAEFTTPAGRVRVLRSRDRLDWLARQVKACAGYRVPKAFRIGPRDIPRDREDWPALKPATDHDCIRLARLSDDDVLKLAAQRKADALAWMRKRWTGQDCRASQRLIHAREIEEAQRELVRRGLLDATDHDKVNAEPVQEAMQELESAPALPAPALPARDAITSAVTACLADAVRRYGDKAKLQPAIRFDLRGRARGTASVCGGAYALRFNLDAYALDPRDMLASNVPHEVAHIVAHALGHGLNHGRHWRAICIALGGTGERCHTMNLPPARKLRRYRYVATCGTEVMIGPQRHKKLQTDAGTRLRLRTTGGLITGAHYNPEDAPMPKPARAPKATAKPAPVPKPTRAVKPAPKPASKPAPVRAVPALPAAYAPAAVEIVEAIETTDGQLFIAAFDDEFELLALHPGMGAHVTTPHLLRLALAAPAGAGTRGWPAACKDAQAVYDRITETRGHYNVIGRWLRDTGLDLTELRFSRLLGRAPRNILGPPSLAA